MRGYRGLKEIYALESELNFRVSIIQIWPP